MDYGKIDSALASALEGAQDGNELLVFISTDNGVFTGKFSVRAIGELSDQSWVKRISLSKELNLK